MKRFVSIAVVLMAMVGLVWATPTSEEKAKMEEAVELLPNSWETFKDEPITLTAFWDVPREFGDVNTDALVPTKMREHTGVRLDVKTTIDDTEQSLNLLIASGDLPDFMYINYERRTGRTLVESDLLHSYGDLNDKYGVDLVSKINRNQRFVQRATFGTKEIYYLNQAGVPADKMDDPWVVKYQTGIFVNRLYYDEIGAPSIDSMEDFIEVATKAKQMIPKCTYPVNVTRRASGRRGLFKEPPEVIFLLPFYGLANPANYNSSDGKNHKFYFQTPAFVDLLKDLNRIVNLDLIGPKAWTGTSGGDKLSYFFEGSGMFDMQNDADNIDNYTGRLQKADPRFSCDMLAPFSAYPGKYDYSAADQFGIGERRGFTIPKGNENTLRTLTYMDYLFSDTFQKLLIYGREGIEHELVDGVPVFTDETKKKLSGLSGDQQQAEYAFNFMSGDLRDGYWAFIQRQQDLPNMKKALNGVLAPTVEKFQDITMVAAAQVAGYPTDSEELKIYSAIREVFGDEVAKIIKGPPENVESAFAALMNRVQNMELAKLNEFQGKNIADFAEKVEMYKD